MRSAAVEDYVKTAYEIQRERGRVTTMELSRRLGVRPASVTGMTKKLVEKKLAAHAPYRGFELTESGVKMALRVLRNHRLIELFLVRVLGLAWDEVHEDAERLEHAISEPLMRRIDEYLGHPIIDPHGAPIPGEDSSEIGPLSIRLSELAGGQSGIIAEVDDHDPELLRYAGERGLYPGTKVEVVSIDPLGELRTIRVGRKTHTLGERVAGRIGVTDIDRQPDRTE